MQKKSFSQDTKIKSEFKRNVIETEITCIAIFIAIKLYGKNMWDNWIRIQPSELELLCSSSSKWVVVFQTLWYMVIIWLLSDDGRKLISFKIINDKIDREKSKCVFVVYTTFSMMMKLENSYCQLLINILFPTK